jgi:hypothetical protein
VREGQGEVSELLTVFFSLPAGVTMRITWIFATLCIVAGAENAGQSKIDARTKRGVFNFVGEISKILFGTLDNADAEYYEKNIHFK